MCALLANEVELASLSNEIAPTCESIVGCDNHAEWVIRYDSSCPHRGPYLICDKCKNIVEKLWNRIREDHGYGWCLRCDAIAH